MSKQVDPKNVTADDVIYISQRPNLRQEFILQGFGDPLDPDYPGLVDSDGSGTPKPKLSEDVVELQKHVESLLSENSGLANEVNVLRKQLEDIQQATTPVDEDGENDGELVVELPVEKQWNEDMKKKELIAVIDARNADYEDDEKITFENDKNETLIAALVADDQELAGEE